MAQIGRVTIPNCGFKEVRLVGKKYKCSSCGQVLADNFGEVVKATLGEKDYAKFVKQLKRK